MLGKPVIPPDLPGPNWFNPVNLSIRKSGGVTGFHCI